MADRQFDDDPLTPKLGALSCPALLIVDEKAALDGRLVDAFASDKAS